MRKRTWRKIRQVFAAGLVLLCAGMPTVLAADGTAAIYIVTQQGSTLSVSQNESAVTYWEAPDVTTGQTRMDGTITLKNESSRTVDFVLDTVSLPYGDTVALTYLDAVSVDLSEGETVYYHGSFTHIMDSDRAEVRVAQMAPGEQRVLTVAVSCAYTYEGTVPAYSSMVWSFLPQVVRTSETTAIVDPMPPRFQMNWLLMAEIAGGLVLVTGVVGVCVWLRRRR